MEKEKTERGFSKGKFKDRDGMQCSIQESSIAAEACIWLGASKIEIQIGYPWREISEEDIKSRFNATEIVGNNRMHLNRKQVKELLPLLINFVETGEL